MAFPEFFAARRKSLEERLKRALEPIRAEMDILENGAYHARLLMYKGLRTPESVLNLNTADDVQIATQGYGVGNWYLVNGDKVKAREWFGRSVNASGGWPGFGFIVSEVELRRLR